MNRLEKKGLESNISKYYIYYVASRITFISAIFVLFFQSFNLSFTQIAIIMTTFSVVMVALEIPTGAFADIVGRKKALVYSSILLFIHAILLASPIFLPINAFITFLIAYFLAGIGVALGSGADSALFYDTLKHLKKEEKFMGHFARFESRYRYFGACAVIIGGIFGHFSLNVPIMIQIIPATITFFAALSFYEIPFRHEKLNIKGHLNKMGSAFSFIRKQRVLWWTILFSASFMAFSAMMGEYDEIFLKFVGVPIFLFGFLFSITDFATGFLASKSESFINKVGSKSWILLSLAPFLVFLMYLKSDNLYIQIGILILFFLFQLIAFFAYPLFETVMQANTKSEIRATVGSVQSMGMNVLYLFFPLYGLLTDKFTLFISTKVVGLFSLLIFGILLLTKPKIKIKKLNL